MTNTESKWHMQSSIGKPTNPRISAYPTIDSTRLRRRRWSLFHLRFTWKSLSSWSSYFAASIRYTIRWTSRSRRRRSSRSPPARRWRSRRHSYSCTPALRRKWRPAGQGESRKYRLRLCRQSRNWWKKNFVFFLGPSTVGIYLLFVCVLHLLSYIGMPNKGASRAGIAWCTYSYQCHHRQKNETWSENTNLVSRAPKWIIMLNNQKAVRPSKAVIGGP